MTRRPAVTLMEVLIAMFIMAIGMMALMVLFPVGAVSMAQALKDDRCATASYVSENVAIATNLRYGDANVNGTNPAMPNTGFPSTVLPTPAQSTALSGLLYVDPYGVQGLLGPLGGTIQRISPFFITSGGRLAPQLTDRWFSLQDDVSFNLSGMADTSNTGGLIDRGRHYSFAYLLRRNPPVLPPPGFTLSPMYTVQSYAVVYHGRPVSSLTQEPNYNTAGTVGTNSLVVSPTSPNPWPPNIKRGGWILDPVNGYFYRVTNLSEISTPPTLSVEVQQNLRGLPGGSIATITVMENVAEVFDKGVGWQQ